MPIYEYKCNRCEEVVSELLDSYDEALRFDGTFCKCGGQLKRIYSYVNFGRPKHDRAVILSNGERVKGKFGK